MPSTFVFALFVATLAGAANAIAGPSQCYGTVSHGRITDSVSLPASGTNFIAYHTEPASHGRTHVHSTVAEIIVATYAALATTRPHTTWVYGETGVAAGGPFPPHRSHQNGTSVDFFVPVINAIGKSTPLPTDADTHYGYDIEFDAQGRYRDYRIDFDAMAEHLYQLQREAKARSVDIALVIFDLPYLPRLFATHRGAYLKRNLVFMKTRPWVRHDEHYHVDFAIPCKLAAP